MTDGVKTVVRAFALLEAFKARRGPLRLRDAVEVLQGPSSSIADVLKTLTQLGYLNFDWRHRSYFPTPKLAQLGAWVDEILFEDQRVVGAMNALADRTGEAILLGTGSELEMQYLRSVPSTHAVRYVVTPNARRPLIRSGFGWALLSLESESDIRRIYRASPASDRKRIALPELLDQISACRQQGFITSRNLVHEGVSTLVVPIESIAPLGRRIAIGIVGPTERMTRMHHEYVQALKSTLGPSM